MVGRVRLSLWVMLLVFLVVSITCVVRKDKGDNMKSETTADFASSREIEIIRGFLIADSKYDIVPVPTGLDPKNVLNVVRKELIASGSTQKLQKLSELTIFYNLKNLSADFLTFLIENEKNKGNCDLSLICIITLVWIAEDQDLLQAQNYFQKLLQRTIFPDNRHMILQTCNALNSQQALSQVKAWLHSQTNQIDRKIEELKGQSTTTDIRRFEEKKKAIESFLKNDVGKLEAYINERIAIETVNDSSERLKKITLFYLHDFSEQWYWAAMKLIRQAGQSDEARQAVALGFLKLSQAYVIDDKRYEQLEAQYDEDDDAQYDDTELVELHSAILKRTRCLRAAEFFGDDLNDENSAWLSRQEDMGTDPLALRPDWKYPISSVE